jgi:hypothetical protein
MTTRSIPTARALGFLAFTLSVLPVPTAEAADYIDYDYVCTKGGVVVERGKHLDS